MAERVSTLKPGGTSAEPNGETDPQRGVPWEALVRRSIRIAVVTAALFLVFPVATVQATPPTGVHFDIETTIVEGGPNGGPFVASGPAVDAGLMCAAGDTVDTGLMAVGFSRTGVVYLVLKQFTCADESGTFTLRLEVRVDSRGDNFNWQVMSGTDDYARLRGTGTGYGDATTYGVLDQLDGGLHLD